MDGARVGAPIGAGVVCLAWPGRTEPDTAAYRRTDDGTPLKATFTPERSTALHYA